MTKDNSTGKPKDFYSRGQQMFDSLNLPDDDDDTQVYKKPWVGLTEDEAFVCRGRDYFETYKAIEAKLKERNT